MPRLVTMWFPQWSAVAAGIHGGEALAVVHANRVVAMSPAAEVAGVQIGVRRREAQARCSGIRIVQRDPDRDARRFEPVVRAIAELVPSLEVTEPGLITFASRGPSRYAGGDAALARRVIAIAEQVLTEQVLTEQVLTEQDTGVPMKSEQAVVMPSAPSGPVRRPATTPASPVRGRVAVGIAEGRFASGVAARRAEVRGDPCVIAAGGQATVEFLSRFPVEVLVDVAAFDPDFTGLLRRLGIVRLEQLAALPATDILARFGNDGIRAHRLANGDDERPPDTRPVPPELFAERVFEDAVAQVEPLVFAGRQCAEELHQAIAVRGSICVRLAIEAETDEGERTERVWYQPAGMRVATMVERVRWQLDGWVRQPGGLNGGVVVLRLTPVEIKADDGRQLGFWGGRTQADEWAQRAITRLGGMLGPDAVTVPVWRGGREPARHYELVPAVDRLEVDTDAPLQTAKQRRPRASGVTASLGIRDPRETPAVPPWPGQLPKPSPSQLFIPAEACTVEDDSGRPVSVSGRGFVSAAPAVLARNHLAGNHLLGTHLAGNHQPGNHPGNHLLGNRPGNHPGNQRRVRVAAWAGPWPLEERWWEAGGRRRARFQLVTEDGIAYLAAVEAGQWWLDATYA